VNTPELNERSGRDVAMLGELLNEALEDLRGPFQVPFDLLFVQGGLQEFGWRLLGCCLCGEEDQHRQRGE